VLVSQVSLLRFSFYRDFFFIISLIWLFYILTDFKSFINFMFSPNN
jgi:hypothetical protein